MARLIKYVSPLLLLHLYVATCSQETPQLTIVMVIDQLAYRHLDKLRPYLKGGLKFLLNEGIVYTQAHTPYACPETGPGHTTLNTGVPPKLHGIAHNGWCEGDCYKPIDCDDGSATKDAVFGPHGLLPYGKSPQYIMVDGISDQLMMQTDQHKEYRVFSIGMKSRSAICTANKMGKAIWFDTNTGIFTSSKAYYQELPAWINDFNKKHLHKMQSYTWQLFHGCLPAAYRFKHAHNYKGSALSQTLIGKTIKPNMTCKEPFKNFAATPAANKLIFDAALACIDDHFCKNNRDEKMFLWVLIGGLDKLCHIAGPNSIEVIDMIYHLDHQIKRFMDCVNAKTCKRNILWALTADHGVSPLPEQMIEDGYSAACRILVDVLTQEINQQIKKDFNIEKSILYINGNSVHLNKPALKTLEKEKRNQIKKAIIELLEKQNGIKKVWTCKELRNLPTTPNSIENYYQNELFKGRAGNLVIYTYPYCLLARNETGTDHHSPYNYDTHIPIIIYQRAWYQRKIIDEPVYNTQFAPTLSYILKAPRPSACTADVLPGIIFKEDCCF